MTGGGEQQLIYLGRPTVREANAQVIQVWRDKKAGTEREGGGGREKEIERDIEEDGERERIGGERGRWREKERVR